MAFIYTQKKGINFLREFKKVLLKTSLKLEFQKIFSQ